MPAAVNILFLKSKKKKKEWKLGTGGRRFGSGLSLERALSPQALCSQTLGLPLALAVLGQQPSDGTRQLQGLIFAKGFQADEKEPKVQEGSRSFPRDRSAKRGGQLVTSLTGGHSGWHSVRPWTCHLSLGFLREASHWSLHRFLLHSPAAMHSDGSLCPLLTLCQALAGCQTERERSKPRPCL